MNNDKSALEDAKDAINVPITLSGFRDNGP